MRTNSASIRTRWAAIGAAVAVTIGAAGIGGYSLVNAEVSSGDRPVFVSINPCRLTDTRAAPNTVGSRATPVGADETIAITAHGDNGECTGASTIPNDALALAMNVTALNATSQTFLTFWGNGTNPGTANLNPAPGQPPTPNAVNTPLSNTGTFNLYNERGTVNVVIDVNGYYTHHNHDDRYIAIGDAYTKAEADTEFASAGNVYTKDETDTEFASADNVYTKDETDALLGAVPDEVSISPFDFRSEDPAGDDWSSTSDSTTTLGHDLTAGEECVFAPVELPAGRTVAGGSITYVSTAPGTVNIRIYGVNSAAGTFTEEGDVVHLVFSDDIIPLLPAAVEGEILKKTFTADPDTVVRENFSYVVTLCTAMQIAVTDFSISTPEA